VRRPSGRVPGPERPVRRRRVVRGGDDDRRPIGEVVAGFDRGERHPAVPEQVDDFVVQFEIGGGDDDHGVPSLPAG